MVEAAVAEDGGSGAAVAAAAGWLLDTAHTFKLSIIVNTTNIAAPTITVTLINVFSIKPWRNNASPTTSRDKSPVS
ncbi:hypothetical protein Hanom_Chr05g00474121 [Helianthus anomalus]